MCVLVDGVLFREKANGVVVLPFNSEYILRFHNKHDRRAVVQIYIDGENVSGSGYIIDAHSSIDIKRYSDKDRAFKFVSLDSDEAKKVDKNGANEDKIKGTVEARFYLEKKNEQYIYNKSFIIKKHCPQPIKTYPDWPYPYPNPKRQPYPIWCNANSTPTCSYSNNVTTEIHDSSLKDGCTVSGQITRQSFSVAPIDLEDTFTSLKIFLQGLDDLRKAKNFTLYCDKCGAKALRNSSKYCHVCGNKFV